MAKDKNPLDGVVRFIGSEGWQDQLQAVLLEHTQAACDALGMSQEQLAAQLDQQIYAMMFTCVVEDLMSRTSADGRNVTDEFVKRHGWKLGGSVKRQLETLRQSKSAMYEITAITPGVGLTLKNLLAPETTISVQAPALSGALPVGCPVGLRVLEIDGTATLSGGILPFEEGMSDEATTYLQENAAGAENLAPFITAFWVRKTIEEQRSAKAEAE